MTKKTPQEIRDQYKAGHQLDTGHEVVDGHGQDSDFVHADGESWERRWTRVPDVKDGI